MPDTKAHPNGRPDLYPDYANVVALPPEARPIGMVAKSAIVAKAQEAIEFHENIAAYHTREAGKIREQVAKLQART